MGRQVAVPMKKISPPRMKEIPSLHPSLKLGGSVPEGI